LVAVKTMQCERRMSSTTMVDKVTVVREAPQQQQRQQRIPSLDMSQAVPETRWTIIRPEYNRQAHGIYTYH
jgi:hypothetical protein